jgi:hypothetical protein
MKRQKIGLLAAAFAVATVFAQCTNDNRNRDNRNDNSGRVDGQGNVSAERQDSLDRARRTASDEYPFDNTSTPAGTTGKSEAPRHDTTYNK